MVETLIDILIDAISDNWLTLPLLWLAYLVIEHFDRKEMDDSVFFSMQKYGPLIGSLLGVIPQCGFSIIAAMLYMGNNITLGTLISVFIACSDEAIPILIAHPSMYSSLVGILLFKIILGIAVGYLIDYVIFRNQKILRFEDMEEEDEEEEDIDEEEQSVSCPCCYPQYPIPVSALIRAFRIFAFLFITTVVLDLLIAWIGEDTLSVVLLSGSLFQPMIAALFGFIPNCAASVVLTQLYAAETVSFASLLSGLITNAGMGILVLVRYGAGKKEVLKVLCILFVVASVVGIALSMVL